MDLLTPRGRSGVAALRARGEERVALLATLFTPSGHPMSIEPDDPPRRARWRLAGGIEDDVIVVDRGFDCIEVHAHGSLALLDAVAATFGPLAEPACDPAGRLLREALSREQMLLALEQQQHDFQAWLRGLLLLPADERMRQAIAGLERSKVAMAQVHPARVVLAGRQNAGKSTLFNRLVFCERSLAGPTAGLTRDAVAERTALAGYPYEFVDTAGESTSSTGVDAEAIERSRAARRGAAVVLLVVDGNSSLSPSDLQVASRGALVVATKADLPEAAWDGALEPAVRVSAADPASAATIRASLGEVLRAFRKLPVAGPVGGPAALDDRQLEALSLVASGSALPSA